MAELRDALVYVTGIVGRSMGSGKFASSDLLDLTRNAYAAFCDVFGKPEAPAAYQPKSSPGASQGPQRPDWHAGAQSAQSHGTVPPESKPLSAWGGDKAYIGKKEWQFAGKSQPDVTWGEWLGAAAEGDEKAKKALEYASGRNPFEGEPKWHQANARRVGRAKACLIELAKGYAVPDMGPTSSDPLPY